MTAKKDDDSTVSIIKLLPNMVTIFGLCMGLSAIRLALKGQFEMALGFIVIASIIDGVDGRFARMLNATSEFGAQLDSLADFLNFGVAPPFILYLWIMRDIKGLGWAVVLFYVICCAIRLARFNTDLTLSKVKKTKDSDRFFSGMPAPAGALMVLGPMMVVFAFKQDYPELFSYFTFFGNSLFVCCYAVFMGAYMASRIPTYSFKNVTVPKEHTSIVLVATAVVVIAVLTKTWITMVCIGLLYYCTLPMSIMSHAKTKKD